MAITQEVISLGTFGLEERRRTSARGTKSRYTISIKSEPILHVFDAAELGRKPALAIAEAIKKAIRDITQVARPATLAFRQRAKLAYARGASWAMDRYSGGRTGGKAPAQGVRAFNDSGRFADSITAGPAGDEWVINVAANRLDPSTFSGGAEAVKAMHAQLVALVPMLADPGQIARAPGVSDAIGNSIYDVIVTANEALGAKGAQLRREIRSEKWELLRMLAEGLDLL